MCLCGSNKKFKNCCKKSYLKSQKNGTVLFNTGKYYDALRATRNHITWYKLCHLAHTAGFYKAKPSAANKMMNIDIEALSELVGLLMHCYKYCGINNEFPSVLKSIENAIQHEGWRIKVDYHNCAYLYLCMGQGEQAKLIADKYLWNDLQDSDFLTLYIDLYQNDLNQVELIGAANKVVAITSSPAEKLQYSCMAGIQHCLLNDLNKGSKIVLEAIHKYEKIPDEDKSQYGKMRLINAYTHVGLLLNNIDLLNEAITRILKEIYSEEYSDAGLAQLYLELGECFLGTNEINKSEASLVKSLNLHKIDLAEIFLARALTRKNKNNEARYLLSNIDLSNISKTNIFDLAISLCRLALNTKNSDDINIALDKIKSIQTNDPMFLNYVKDLTIELYELKSSVKSIIKAESALEKFNRYVQLKPNIMGIGVDFNAVIEDLINNK
jgi:tetratricopeptide (TPR) repeat protein